MVVYAQRLYEFRYRSRRNKVGKQVEPEVEQEAEHYPEQERHDYILRQRTSEYSNCRINCTEEEKSDFVNAPNGSIGMETSRKCIENRKSNVGNNAISTKTTAARYLAVTILNSEIGRVRRSSMLPVRSSSANIFIVIAGTRKRNTHGEIRKSVSMLAAFT